ncbi:T9SS type A sorting domain-containing protein [Chryseobacterium sp. JJR-5R]|uniref:T9SS type A sorting domain-containing protein n=1 Tax=Chryseobacterium sp. JJR-5R TaxID=3093923 RepID=UPI002A763490|nr:T9SS type A sorting domain-containing protein [Chryseobacterium sp. JJR-5R]WPO83283.1 T9SS type A sorting domain-containing protein [Chryseobacterium sp. JJR-5R]
MKKFILLLFLLPSDLWAQTLPFKDTTFNTSGKALLSVWNNNYANCTAVQADKKMLIGGSIHKNNPTTVNSFLVARYNENGTLDTTFASNGLLYDPAGNSSVIYDMKVLSDGKILIAGRGNASALIGRLLPDGTLDLSFGTNGTALLSGTYIRDLEILSDGSIIGYGDKNSSSYLVKINSSGQIDTTFGTGGEISAKFGYSSLINNAMTKQADGKYIISGAVVSNASYPENNQLFLARYNVNGNLDTTFGSNGLLLYSATAREARDVLFTAAGKILVLGEKPYASTTSIGPNSLFYLLQFNTDGTLDTAFNSTGTVGFGFNYYSSVKTDAQNKIYVSGSYFDSTNYYNFRRIIRLNENGSPDTTFGTNGFYSSNDRVYASEFRYGNNSMNFTPDGKLVSSGYVNIPSFSIILMRLIISSTNLSTSDFTSNPENISVYPNPAEDYFIVKSKDTIESLELINTLRQSLTKQNNATKIDVKNLPAGNYFLKVKTYKEEKTFKVSKK